MKQLLVRFFASGFGTGAAPVAPGTFGTLPAIPFALLFASMPVFFNGVLLLALLPVAAYICGSAEKLSEGKDPGWVVIDEMMGFWFATAFLEPTVVGYLLAFLLFRLFDIIKPPPASWFDQHGKGGWGILLDDVVAGIYARIVLIAAAAIGLI